MEVPSFMSESRTPVADADINAVIDRIDPLALDALLVEYRNKVLDLARPDAEPTLVSIEDAAQRLGISRRHFYNLANKGLIESVTLGRRRLVPVAEVERLIRNGRQSAR